MTQLTRALVLLTALSLCLMGCDDTRGGTDSGPRIDSGRPAMDGGRDSGTPIDSGTDSGTPPVDGGPDAGPPPPPENSDATCGNGIDDDRDGLTDCADDSCHGHPFVTVCTEDCTTPGDDDLDGFADCEDRDCWDTPGCLALPSHQEAGAAECGNGLDDDGDGFRDCADFSCQGTVPSCNEATDEVSNCADGIDNNSHSSSSTFGDFVDCTPGTPDRQCELWGQCPGTVVEASAADCDDGIDNDGDGFTDCDDRSCQRSQAQGVCDGNAVTCADGMDNDGDGFADCSSFACRCCPGEGDACGQQRSTGTCAPCAE
ncbi:MAG: hypothetical protein AB8I08_40525 [Sandaracinaceae bacterium]